MMMMFNIINYIILSVIFIKILIKTSNTISDTFLISNSIKRVKIK